jgi:hypothetical protein
MHRNNKKVRRANFPDTFKTTTFKKMIKIKIRIIMWNLKASSRLLQEMEYQKVTLIELYQPSVPPEPSPKSTPKLSLIFLKVESFSKVTKQVRKTAIVGNKGDQQEDLRSHPKDQRSAREAQSGFDPSHLI